MKFCSIVHDLLTDARPEIVIFALNPTIYKIMTRTFLFALALSLVSVSVFAGNNKTVAGYVYHDIDSNGVFDKKNEKGLPSIAVSNGRDVVLTDKNGRYELPLYGDCEIFVIKPTGYAAPVNSYGIPQTYYVYRPAGSSADMKYKGIAPTGKLPREVNFPLYPSQEPEKFSILVFGDPQSRDRTDAGYFGQQVVRPLIDSASAYKFGILLGDISFNDLTVFEPVMNRAALIGIPWYPLPGNHDHNQDKNIKYDSLTCETYTDFFGPATYSFNYGKVHFIMTDDVVLPNPAGKSQYTGGLSEKQFAFIENDLKFVPKDYLVVFAGHIQLFDTNPAVETFRDADRRRLLDLLGQFENSVSLSAHTHYIRPTFFSEEDGWKGNHRHMHINAGATCADWYKGLPDPYGLPNAMMRDGSPQGYFTLDFDGNSYVHTYHASRQGDFRDMSISLGDSLFVGLQIPVYANFYNGNELSVLSYRIDGGDWVKMYRVIEVDPVFSRLNKLWNNPQYKLPGRKVSGPVKSYHLWKALMPAFGKAGVHVAEVEAIDMYGRRYTEKYVFEVL